MAGIMAAGSAEFARALREACRDSCLSVAGVAVSAGDLAEQIEVSGAGGVIAPADWLEIMVALAPVKRNVVFGVAGNVTRDERDRLADHGVLLLPSDPRRAARAMAAALERTVPAGYRGDDHPVTVDGADTVTVPRPAMVLFYSRKGGVGKTATAANVAAAVGLWTRGLRKTGPEPTVALWDNNPEGNLLQYFGYTLHRRPAQKTAAMADLTPAASREAVLACLDYHSPANVYLGVAPGPGRKAGEKLAAGLGLLARYFHFVFVDLGVRLDAGYAAVAAAHATDVVLLSDTDPRTVSFLHAYREEVTGFFGGAGKFKLAVNHHSPGGELSARKVAGLLDMPLAAELPYCEAMGRSRDVPVVCADPRGKYAGEVVRLSRSILGAAAIGAAAGRRGLLGRFLKQ